MKQRKGDQRRRVLEAIGEGELSGRQIAKWCGMSVCWATEWTWRLGNEGAITHRLVRGARVYRRVGELDRH